MLKTAARPAALALFVWVGTWATARAQPESAAPEPRATQPPSAESAPTTRPASLPALSASAAVIAPERSPTYVIEAVLIRGNHKTRDYVIRRAVEVRAGERLSVDDPRFDASRYRVLALGFFSDVRLHLEKGSSRGRARLIVDVEERGTILLTEIFLGTSEATSAWGGLGLAENNFLGHGFSVEGAFVLGADPQVERADLQQSYLLRASTRQIGGSALSMSTTFRYLAGSEFFRRSGSDTSSDPKDFLSIRYRRIGGTLGIGLDISRFSRLFIDYRGEQIVADVPFGAVRLRRSGVGEPIDFAIRNGYSVLSSVTLTLERDTRTDPVLPKGGSLLSVAGMGATGVFGSSYDFFKLSSQYAHYFSLPWHHVVGLKVYGGVVFGYAPFFERFFIGDLNDLIPARVLGLNFSTLPSRNFFDNSISDKRYEEIAMRSSVEYIYPWFRGRGFAYGGDFFLDVGVIMLTSRDDMRVRDVSLSQAIPIDLTIDAGLRLDTYIGIFRFSVGNFIGRIPF